MVTYSSLAYSAHQDTLNAGIPVKLSHINQLLAAALGFSTFESLKARGIEHEIFADGTSLILDPERIKARAVTLGVASPYAVIEIVVEHLKATISHVHRSEDDLVDDLQEFLNAAVPDTGAVTSQTAMTNGWLGEVYLPLDLNLDDLPEEEGCEIEVVGHVSMEQDIDRPYSGHHVDVTATIILDRWGAAVFGKPQLGPVNAELDYNW